MLSYDMKPQPVIESAGNVTVFTPEHLARTQDITNSVDHSYEYAQPKSYRLTANNAFQTNNPFDTPCQVAMLYANVNDATGLLALTFDNNDPTALNTTTSITDFPGLLISQTGLAPLAPALQWIDFQQFVMVRASGITTFTEFCLLFRRRRDMYVPRNLTAFNELTQ